MPHRSIFFRYIFLILGLLLLLSTDLSAGSYTDSAHGNSTVGVSRQATRTAGYARGNCGHCHEQHASIDNQEPVPSNGSPQKYLLMSNSFSGVINNPYSQSDVVCFYCHATTGSIQDGGIINKNYSATFAGAAETTNSIQSAFNQTSYHNLYDVRRFITGQSGTKTFSDFPADSSPCNGCHNVHLAKLNRANPGNPTFTAISKPSEHNQLFGDDNPAERMSNPLYGDKYQPPQYFSSTNLEPDGSSSDRATQAEKTPDYSKFCSDCHNSTNVIYSTPLGRNLRKIDWDNEKHGRADADGYISVDAPFTAGSGALGYVLSCLDCHEPHGSPNAFLIRREVNGGTLAGTITETSGWSYLCERCHDNSNETIHHFSSDRPYQKRMCGSCHSSYPIRCSNCHFHGSWVNDPSNPYDKTPSYSPTTRVTF